jgi:hypothetical protein
MNNARLLFRMDLVADRREIEGLLSTDLPSFTYVPLGFMPVGEHKMIPTYPMGLSLMVLGMSQIVGWEHAAAAVIVLHALLAVMVMYCLSIVMGLSRSLALLGAVFLGFSSLFVFLSLQLMSDMPALAWCSIAVLSAWLSRRNSPWALLAGAAFSVCVLIRPTNILLLLPLAIVFGLVWKRWFLFGAGGIPGAIFQVAINLKLYGRIVATGYGDVSSLFGFKYLGWSAQAYAYWLPVDLTPAVLLIPGILLIPSIRRSRLVLVLVVWVAAFLGFYAFYFHTSENWTYIRFVLPAFSAMIVLMLMVMRRIASAFSVKLCWTLGLGLMIFVIGWNVAWIQRFGIRGLGESVYLDAAAWTKESLPKNAVILSMQTSGSLFYYTGFTILRYDFFDRNTFAKVEDACVAAARPIYAVLFHHETGEVLSVRIPGKWTKINSIHHVTIWRREPA